jgi:hypothetical protein
LKTHELAKWLIELAKWLKKLPNTELSDMGVIQKSLIPAESSAKPKRSDIPAALATLTGLARFTKSEWKDIIKEYELGVEIKANDSTRDLLGRLLNHLKDNPEAIKKITATKSKNISSELQEALSILLK